MTRPQSVTVKRRRRALVRRHHLVGDAEGPEEVVRDLVALHATDPASVYLSTIARSASTSLDDVAAAMYERRTLVRWMAMRRTLFLVARTDVPIVQAAVTDEVARTLRARLVTQLQRNGTEPPTPTDASPWLSDLEEDVMRAIADRGSATGAQLASDVPALKTRIRARTRSERPHNLTTQLLTLMSAEGQLIRGTPTGAWTTRQHRWEPPDAWWPDGVPAVDPDQARRALARRWLERFGPARIEDLQWWTGWNATTVRQTIAHLPIHELDLHGQPGIGLAGTIDEDSADEGPDPVAALLPTLDPTPMGWKDRSWFLAIDPALVFDRAGNIGPTVWWDGEIIGSWATTPAGELHWKIVADRGSSAQEAVAHAASQLQARLEGSVIIPAVRTPLERSLSSRRR